MNTFPPITKYFLVAAMLVTTTLKKSTYVMSLSRSFTPALARRAAFQMVPNTRNSRMFRYDSDVSRVLPSISNSGLTSRWMSSTQDTDAADPAEKTEEEKAALKAIREARKEEKERKKAEKKATKKEEESWISKLCSAACL